MANTRSCRKDRDECEAEGGVLVSCIDYGGTIVSECQSFGEYEEPPQPKYPPVELAQEASAPKKRSSLVLVVGSVGVLAGIAYLLYRAIR